MMEGHNNHTYLPEDLNFDELMGTGWPATATDNTQYSNFQHAPHQYGRFAPDQTTYSSYDPSISQAPSYPAASYQNSPYVSQFQNTRPSSVYNQNSFAVDPSMSSQGYHGHGNGFPFVPQAMENTTIAPQNLQYAMPTQTVNRATDSFQQRPGVEVPSYLHRPTQDAPPIHTGMYFNSLPSGNAAMNQNNLPQYANTPLNAVTTNSTITVQRPLEKDRPAQRSLSVKEMPQQDFLRTTRPELLATHSSTRPPFEYAAFIHWEDKPVEITLGLKSTIPHYHPRKSRSGKDLVPGLDIIRSSTAAGTTVRRGRPPKEKRLLVSKYKGTSKSARPLATKVSQLREDGTIVASPAASTETSSSEEETSSEEESEYEEDEEEMKLTDIKEIRGAERPTYAPDAAKWDVIGILWKDSVSSPSSEVLKDAIEKYGNFVSTLRLKIKINSTKIEAAAARPLELQVLRDERTILLDSLLQAIEAANVHGYLPIVENLGGHHKLVNGLTTTLIECVKLDDFNGRLPKAVLTLLSKFQTMTDDLLKKLKFESIHKRWIKKGDDETKKLISEIVANTTDSKERAVKSKKSADHAEEERKLKEKMEAVKIRASPMPNNGSSVSAKRPHENDTLNGKATKKLASDVHGIPGSAPKLAAIKRPTGNLLGIASRSKPVKKREISPPSESKLGALLASIAKPPELPKAPATTPRTPETPAEQKKRERKESRRHLRVKFKEGGELEQIRLFKHEQVEDEGRQDEMLKDAHDDRSEGMMHKNRIAETVDDEEEYQPMDYEQSYPELVAIDFSPLEKQTRFGPGYTSRGGNVQISTSEQKVQQRREEVELVAIYSDPSEIPPSAKEPPQIDGPQETPGDKLKLPNEGWFAQRLQIIDQQGADNANKILLNRGEHQTNHHSQDQSRVNNPLSIPANSATGVSSITKQLVPVQKPPALMSNQQPPLTIWAEIELIINSVKGLPFPPTEPPAWMTNEGQKQIWWDGFYRDKTENERKESEQRAAMETQIAYQPPAPAVQAPQYQQQMPLPPATSYSMPPFATDHTTHAQQTPNLAQKVQKLTAGYQQADPAPAVQQYDYGSWANVNRNAQNDYSGQTEYDSQMDYTGQEQRGWGAGYNENLNPINAGAKSNQHGFAPRSDGNDSAPFDEYGNYMGRKRPCRFWREGKCVKGDKCTYLHE